MHTTRYKNKFTDKANGHCMSIGKLQMIAIHHVFV